MWDDLLERISLSLYRSNLVLKGGFLIASMLGANTRATMDMDTTLVGQFNDTGGHFFSISKTDDVAHLSTKNPRDASKFTPTLGLVISSAFWLLEKYICSRIDECV
ncbi:nucleotidyl transferase AbiEii/AbiGii toxin family protein [Schleiferilactobacillus shenzhenensis]|uniref:nucleotidyl transferase AbiEii/AbiGii toxin family protein n=1 Tax=Schleiferilactobacillus shenzhenensis TaxID=1231337 RepID=UPI001FE10BB6|nr:nucleotidyl transferase AbiEii/AbiGii toxin family protein [Schleiferilactobacillus shenzhenensis]